MGREGSSGRASWKREHRAAAAVALSHPDRGIRLSVVPGPPSLTGFSSTPLTPANMSFGCHPLLRTLHSFLGLPPRRGLFLPHKALQSLAGPASLSQASLSSALCDELGWLLPRPQTPQTPLPWGHPTPSLSLVGSCRLQSSARMRVKDASPLPRPGQALASVLPLHGTGRSLGLAVWGVSISPQPRPRTPGPGGQGQVILCACSLSTCSWPCWVFSPETARGPQGFVEAEGLQP